MKTLALALFVVIAPRATPAQQPTDPLAGLWSGEIVTPAGGLETSFLIESDGEGGWNGSADTPAQGVFGLPLTSVELDERGAVVFAMAHARYEATLDADERTLSGHWKQGGRQTPFDCSWAPAPPRVPAELGAELVGTWEGALPVGVVELRIVVVLDRDERRGLHGHVLSPDQTTTEYPVTRIDWLGARRVRVAVSSLGVSITSELSASGAEFAGTYRQRASTFPLTLGRVERATEVRRPQTPAPPFPYRAVEVTYPSRAEGVTLAGTLTEPEGDGPFPAVILITGSGAQDRDETIFQHKPFLVIADHLTRAGIAVLRVDDRGVGGSTAGPSPGTATSADFALDVAGGVAFLASRPEIVPGRIGLVGHSEGGVIAPLVARDTGGVAFLVLLAGTGVRGDALLTMQVEALARAEGMEGDALESALRSQRELLAIVTDARLTGDERRARLREVMESSPELPEGGEREGAIAQGIAQLESPWLRWFAQHDPAPVLAQVDCPVLALGGRLDLQVPWQQNLDAIGAALERGGNEDVTIRDFPGLNHLFQHSATGRVQEYGQIEETFAPAVLDVIEQWIAERFVDDR